MKAMNWQMNEENLIYSSLLFIRYLYLFLPPVFLDELSPLKLSKIHG